ncbi:hypothetical protein B1207_02720 [Legionella quinlivanii]|uniref:Methyltransferase domain-containing protein n=1 Tax=Legionella quinlivanii TaxID=45073 RepID=A0A364LM28_9GAMM|nr:hypothetical protein [Legionella quinlivanii]RAP37921.1 hypothetical protein B1207_02720 [Legionella quinlivanii]
MKSKHENKAFFEKNSWPNKRGLEKIRKLHAYNTETTLKNTPNLLDIVNNIKDDDIVMDMGMGNGQFLIDLRIELNKVKKRAELIGVTASEKEVRHHTCELAKIKIAKMKLPCDSARFQLLQDTPQLEAVKRPEDDRAREYLQALEGEVGFIFDTYGPGTYSYNVLHNLIYAAILLKPSGKYSAISSTGGDNEADLSVLGDTNCREKIQKFFEEKLGISITFEKTAIVSEVNPGAINSDWLIKFEKAAEPLKALTAMDYNVLCRAADEMIGLPWKKQKSWFKYREFEINMRDYAPLKSKEPEAASALVMK